jgi:hypothetical protein
MDQKTFTAEELEHQARLWRETGAAEERVRNLMETGPAPDTCWGCRLGQAAITIVTIGGAWGLGYLLGTLVNKWLERND